MIKIIPIVEGKEKAPICIKNNKIISSPSLDLPDGTEDPVIMFDYLFNEKKCGWKLDCRQASIEEQKSAKAWIQADFCVRIIRALLNFLPIFFGENKFQAADNEAVWPTFGLIQSYMKSSGKTFGFVADDENGMIVKEFTRTSFPATSNN